MPFIIISGSIGEDIAVAAMRAGSATENYIMKDNATLAFYPPSSGSCARRERANWRSQAISSPNYYKPRSSTASEGWRAASRTTSIIF